MGFLEFLGFLEFFMDCCKRIVVFVVGFFVTMVGVSTLFDSLSEGIFMTGVGIAAVDLLEDFGNMRGKLGGNKSILTPPIKSQKSFLQNV